MQYDFVMEVTVISTLLQSLYYMFSGINLII